MKRAAILTGLLFVPAFSAAGVLMTQDKALLLAFPSGAVDRRTIYMNEDERKAVQRQARARVENLVVTYYQGKLADGTSGTAFFETHVVRTMPETFMTVIDSSGTVRFVELLAFYEPSDYQPPKRWLDQFDGKALDDRLLVKRAIRNITGSTLTTQALTDGVRRALALWSHVESRKTKGRTTK